ncbi:MAG: glucoamylase family protein [Clostridia bacterium]
MNSKLNGIFKDAERHFRTINATHKILEKTYELKIPIHSAGQWVLDNMYIIEQEYEEIKDAKKVLKTTKLPVIKNSEGDKYISIFFLAYELIERNNGYVDQNLILNALKEHQKLSYLTSEELDLFVLMLRMALLKFIARICINITNSQIKKMEVEELISNELDSKNKIVELYNDLKQTKNFRQYLQDTTKIKSTNTAFVEYMAYRLKELGEKGGAYFEVLNSEADKIGFTVAEAIKKEHMEIAKTTDFIGRAILAYKQLQGLNFREIFEKVNKIDETLRDDYTHEFKKCDYKTKDRYRKYIIALAKKYDLSEVYIAKKAVECSKKYKKHVGFFLVGEQKYLLKKAIGKQYFTDIIYNRFLKPTKPLLYVVSILILAFLMTCFADRYFINFNEPTLNIIFLVIEFVFSVEIMSKIIDYILRKNIPPKVLPRFDFAKTIDPKYPTYVVMPTLITSIEQVDNMIKKMEVTYLANRTDNMYYMLVGDCISSDKEHIDIDDKIMDYAKEKLDEINKKYENDTEHKLFNFIYRKRIYSKCEGCYMGWERKRGAILQFNSLVLGKMTPEAINKAFYIVYEDIVNAKYAITIDEDTQLSLNTAKDLVAIISHPLNQPVLNKRGTRVKKGYGLIQPSVPLDIEAANRSIFSKIFGGFGGLDIYTNAVANVYQDAFEEAMFFGKGIYNIELFDRLLSKEIPENLVLSHDFLEGAFLKVGLASDIEVQDGFPKNFIAYMKRSHRWYRGDMQIIKWLFSNKLSILSKWKLFDNIRRPLLDVVALIAMSVALFISSEAFLTVTLLTFITINIGHFLGILDRILFGNVKHTKDLQYIPLIQGLDADFLTMCFNFMVIPYRAIMCISAFGTSIYRMLISKKHLLQWTTGDVLEKTSKDSIGYYYGSMFINVVYGLCIMFIPVFSDGSIFGAAQYKVCIALAFIFGPLFAYLLGKDHLIGRKTKLSKKQDTQILDIAKRTWDFFDTMMNETNNFLPTDNFQENRRYKIANRTSSTDIGFGLLAIVNAYDLGFISKDSAIRKLEKVYSTINKLDKWNGHLYNWYNIKTLEPLRPRFISTIDSGNFIACIYVVKQFLTDIKTDRKFVGTEKIEYDKGIDALIEMSEGYIADSDFTMFYDTSRNLFSIGYAQESGTLVDSYYDMLMSESRTTSLIAIARRQVTSKHWFALARNLVKVDGYKGLMSWSGTSFEYFMPYIFNKSYEHTLIDQSLFFTKYSQIKFAKTNNVAWGISESAYAVKDEDLNYQYKAFGIPWLGLKRGLNNYLVVSPYSSLLMLEIDPQRVYKNIKALKSLGAYSTYGFYESIDYTKDHLHTGVNSEVIKTYMAHHQGMILSSINNYINDGIIKKRFHNNPDIRACEILLKERERVKASIKKKAKDKDNVFKQKDVLKYTTYVSSTYAEKKYATENDASTQLNISFLKGGNLSTMITNKGESYLKYKDKIINRQRYAEPQGSGNYIYLTDKTTGNTISATNCNIHSKYNENTQKCVWTSSLEKIDCYIEEENIETTTTIGISPEYNMEMKKISMYNNSNIRREIIINTYIEPALTDYMTNIVHPSFSNLQIETYYDEQLDVLVATRRKKNEEDEDIFVYTKLVGIDLDKDVETEKMRLVKTPESAYNQNIAKYPLWPVLSYRARIILDPHERQDFYYILGVADSKYKMNNAVVNMDIEGIAGQFKLTGELNSVVARYLKLEPTRAEIYNNIIKDVLFKRNQIEDNKYWSENLNQSSLWKHSISGDLPIVLVYINKIEDSGIINEVINFMDYVKNRKIDLDIVIVIDEKEQKDGPIYTYLKERLDRAIYMAYTKGNIYILNINVLTKQEITLLSFLSKRYIQSINEFLCVNTKQESQGQLSSEKLQNQNSEVEVDEN